jgi:DNA-binding transcriptional regulator GbsR (MarR family)
MAMDMEPTLQSLHNVVNSIQGVKLGRFPRVTTDSGATSAPGDRGDTAPATTVASGAAGEVRRAAEAAADPEAVARFVERFGLLLTDAGWPRMPARVFACLLSDEGGRLTARELATRLQVSPAAISGAVRYLAQVGLVARARVPGARLDHYQLADDVWYESFVHRMAQLRRWEQGIAEGVDLVGSDTAAGRRLDESREFFAFLRAEMPLMLERWRARARPHPRSG